MTRISVPSYDDWRSWVPHWRKGRDLELPHCLSVSPHNAESRVPHLARMETQELQFTVHTVFGPLSGDSRRS